MKGNRFADILAKLNDKPQHHDESILLIDGLNTFLRNFTVINLLNINGHHVGGLTGSLMSIGYGIKVTNPTKVIVVFDGVGGSNSRKNLFPAYKGNRHKTRVTNYSVFSNKEEEDESIANQIGRLCNYLQCLPVTSIVIDGLEADDIIGCLVEEYEQNENTKTISIMSADQDFLQLVSKKTQVYSPVKKKIYKSEDILREYGVTTTNFLARKALMGDSSDNVPGIAGLGPKKLEKLFPELSTNNELTLKEILSKAEQGNHHLYDAILERKHQLDINFQIMTLKNLPVSIENREYIREVCCNDSKSIFDKNSFLQMYYGDKLGEAIRNVEIWATNAFGYLANFK